MKNETQKIKQKYKPLHERLQSETTSLDAQKIKQEELNDLYRGVFETEGGQRLLDYLVSKYIGHIPAAAATPNEIMFQHGQSYIVHEILQHMRKEK